MIDLEKPHVFHLKPVPIDEGRATIAPLLLEGEHAVATFSASRDTITFTNKRVITCEVKGIYISKKDVTSLPYSKVQAFSVETASTFDEDAELDLCLLGLGRVNFEFKGKADVAALARVIGQFAV